MDSSPPTILKGDPPEVLVYDAPGVCPYLPGLVARLPMRVPLGSIDHERMAERLHAGDRRQGMMMYRPACAGCTACEAIRIPVGDYEPNKTQRRIWRRGTRVFEVSTATPSVSDEKVRLYNRHKIGRSLTSDGDPIDHAEYVGALVDTCADSFELQYRYDGRLAGVSLCDRASNALSAVYTYFDPSLGRFSPGVFAILTQMEICRRLELPYLYLGLYVSGCGKMDYKARYLPHERLVAGDWKRFDVDPSI